MGKALIIAEKPSVGRDIAKTMGVTQKGDGYLYSDTYIVSWAIGHLVTLCEPEDYDDSLKKWDMAALPIIPGEIKLKPIAKTSKQYNLLKKLMHSREVDYIICATDSGREGELIFRYIYTLAQCSKPFKRLWISSMTDTAIREGFQNIKDGSAYDDLYMSAKCRSEADWLVGINATRAYTVKYNALLSIGRVQTPTLAIISGRQEEINSFVPRDYWEITGIFDSYSGIWIDKETSDTKIFEYEKATEIKKKVTGKKGFVQSVTDEEKRQPPPLLYDLTELQRDCNRRYGYSAQKTLSIAQDLYEKRKLITYPRTDSRYLSSDMLPKITGTLKKLDATSYKKYTSYALELSKLPITKRIIDNSKVSDHHAIIPVETVPKLDALGQDELNVYNLIARRFIAVFYPVYIYNITKIITNVENEAFLTKGTTVSQQGWTELYRDMGDKMNGDGEEAVLPDVKEGDEVDLKEVNLQKKKTQPPKPYTEATLLSAMENAGHFTDDEELKEKLKESGLGTPATRAAIIERLIQVGYITRKGKALAPTEKGMKLIQIVPHEMRSPETTGKWEKGLASIAKGKMESGRFMESISKYIHFIVNSSKETETNVSFPEEARGKKRGSSKNSAKAICKCPKCENGSILENSKGYYCTRWKEGCKFTIWKNAAEKFGFQITNGQIKELCDKKIVSTPSGSIALSDDMSGRLAPKNELSQV